MTKKQKKKIALGLASVTTIFSIPIATVVSCGFNGDYSTNYLHDRREINEYGALSNEVKRRTWDVQFTNGNLITSNFKNSSRVLPLIRIKATGDNIGEIFNGYDKNGKYNEAKIGMKWKEIVKEEKKYVGAQKVEGFNPQTKKWESIDISRMETDINIKVNLDKYTKYRFSINEDKKAKWMTSKGKATDYPLVAKDYFYGWMRSLYASKETRVKGTINGIKRKNIKPFKKGWTSNDIDLSTNNENNYLYDLFGLDIEATIADGLKLSNDDSKFVMTLVKPNASFLDSIISNNSAISPVPSKKIQELAMGSEEPSIKFGIKTYGSNGLENFLHVAPYYYSKYNSLTGYVLEKNQGYIDQNWVNDKDLPKGQSRINKYIYHATQKQDPTANIIQRKTGYEEGKESILDTTVLLDASELENIKSNADKYGAKMDKVIVIGNQQTTIWNPLPNDNFLEKYNDQGRKLMYGFSNIHSIKTQPSALKHFMSGDGAILRHAIDLAYNWYAGVQGITSNSSKMALLSPLAPEQRIPVDKTNIYKDPSKAPSYTTTADVIAAETRDPSKISDAQKIYTRPSGVPSYAELKNSYLNANTNLESHISPSMGEAKKLISSIANKYSGAIIPLQTWNDETKKAANPQTVQQIKTMIEVLNTMAPGKITFKTEIPHNWSIHVKNFQNHDAQFEYAGWGPDYSAATSSLQGIMTNNAGGYLIGQYLDDKNNAKLKPFIDANWSDFKTYASKINLEEWKYFANGEKSKISEEKLKAFRQAELIVSKGYLEKSITDPQFVTEIVSFLQNNGLYFHTTINTYNIIVTDRLQGSYALIVQKKWLHTRKQKDGTIFLQDYSVDL